MPIKLEALIARTQAAIDAEADPRKLRGLQANLAAYLATKAEMDDDEGDDKDEGDEDSKSKKAAAAAMKAKKSAEAAKHRAKAAEYKAKAAESEEAAKAAEEDDEESESEEAKAIAAARTAALTTTPTGHDALLAKLAESVAELKQTQIAGTKTSLIDGARKIGAITKAEAKWLGAQALASVETFLEMRSKAGLVVTSEDALIRPKDAKPGTEESLPAETLQMIESAVNAFTGDRKTYREALVKAHLEAHTKQVSAALNGAPGRY